MKKLTIVFTLLIAVNVFSQDIIIKDINIIPMNENRVLKDQSVLIQNGKIKDIGLFKNLSKNKTTRIIEGKGKYLMPGLADMHVHFPEEDDIEKLLFSNIAAGVTQIRIMNSKSPQLQTRQKLKTISGLISPNVHYSHFISRNDIYTETQADSLIEQIKINDIEFIKLFSLSNEKTFDNLIKAANRSNITVCGHYPVYRTPDGSVMLEIEKVIKSNFKSIEHLAGYIWLKNEEEIENAIRLTKEYNIFNCPTLDWDIMAYDLQYPDDYKKRLTYQLLPDQKIADWESRYASAIEEAGGENKVIAARDKYISTFNFKTKILKKLYESGCLLLIGGDAGNNFQENGFNIYEEMVNWSNIGIDNYTILKSATVSPSLFFNQKD